jgi:hypothetical protein
MSRPTRNIKRTALLVTLVYFALSILVMFQAGKSSAMHRHGTNHAGHHNSFICSWMCAASSGIHSADLDVTQEFHAFSENLPIRNESYFSNLSVYHEFIRPPPTFLA